MSETVFGKSREEEKVIILTEVQRMLNEYYPGCFYYSNEEEGT